MIYGIKLGFSAMFIAICIIVLNIANRARRDGRYYVKCLYRIMLSGAVCTLSNLLILSNNTTICYLGYSIFFAGIDILLLFFVEFAFSYTEFHKPGIPLRILHLITLLDAINILASNFFHHVFLLRTVTFDGFDFYRIIAGDFYHYHLILSYILCGCIFISFIYKCAVTSIFYRKKYIIITLVFLFILLFDGIYMSTDVPVNISIIGYVFGAAFIYYYTVKYVPAAIMDMTLKRVVSNIPNAILVFDNDGNNLYINTTGMRLLDQGNQKTESEKILSSFRSQYPDILKEVVDLEQNFVDQEGEHHYLVSYYPFIDSFGRYSGCFFSIEDRTRDIISAQVEHYRATHDSLTGLYNKEFFAECCKKRLQLHPNEKYILIVSDIDNFKMVNDIFGSSTGDQLLCHIADTISKYAIEEIYCRVENDRFGLLVEEKYYDEVLFADIIHEMSTYGKEDIFPVNIHTGCYRIDDINLPITTVIDRCIIALQTSKFDPDKLFTFYEESMREKLLEEQALLADLDSAIMNEEFIIYLQPQVNTKKEVLGAEALVRWNHYRRGLLFPNAFIPLFEKNGVITSMDIAVWESACKTLASWQSRGICDKYISINISVRDMHFADVYSILTGLIGKYNLPPSSLKLEITESALMVNVQKQLDLIDRLKDFGFTVEMDDFGSGYSSLNMLNRTNLDVLKIDMAFLNHADDIERSGRIIRSIIDMARSLGMESIMEGVETEEEFNYLSTLGIDAIQGYYISKPIPVEEFERLYL